MWVTPADCDAAVRRLSAPAELQAQAATAAQAAQTALIVGIVGAVLGVIGIVVGVVGLRTRRTIPQTAGQPQRAA